MEASAPPAVAQLEHDEILLEGILKIQQSGLSVFWQTEAELKKLVINDYKIETQGQLVKFPDLLIHTQKPLTELTIAIEFERSLKTRRRYIQIMGAYASMRRINALVFVIENPSIEKVIKEVMEETYFPEDRLPVAFMSQREWLEETPFVLTSVAKMAAERAKNIA
jgi:hypothetical protein